MDSPATPTPGIGNRPQARGAVPWNRAVHRVGGLLAVFVMLWLGITGMSMQVIDLHSILTHEPTTTPTQLSMIEGMYGPGDFAVIQVADFAAPALQAGFNIKQGIQTVLQAAHTRQTRDTEADTGHEEFGGRPTSGGPGGSGQPDPMAWVELRILNGVPVGQVMVGTKLLAFNAQTGAPVTAVPPQLLPQGGRLPPSLRQRLKTLHRFWNRHDTPGVYFEFIVGLVLWFLLISGLVIYFQMLGVRFRQGRRNLLWTTGKSWRGMHRVISVLSAAFLICIAFSGTWIGFESSAGPMRRALMTPEPVASAAPRGQGLPGQSAARQRNPVDFILPLRDAEVEEMAGTTLASLQRLYPSTPIKAIRLRTYGQMKQGVIITGGSATGQLVFNADSGEPASLTEDGYPGSNFPFGTQVHENMKHFHSGAMFGVSGRVMNLFAGFSLTFLAISGLVMYIDLWLKRRRINRTSLFWR